jgi:AcrR family transcriptional regulator
MPRANDPRGRERLNRDRVLDAGIALADAEGIDALSMRRLAQNLGVEAMSLYNHVANKDDLLGGMLDRVVHEIDRPDDGATWRERARHRAASAHAVLMRHRWAAGLWSSLTVGPARMRYLDDLLGGLRQAGFTPGLLDRAFHTIQNHVVGHALQALAFPLDSQQVKTMGADLMRTFPVEEYPELAAHIRYHVESTTDGDDEFEFGLDLILDGLERLRAARPDQTPARRRRAPVTRSPRGQSRE